MKTETVIITPELASKLNDLDTSPLELLYGFFGLPLPCTASTADRSMFVYNHMAVLCWESEEQWFMFAPSHPYLCSAANTYEEAHWAIISNIDRLLGSRDLSKQERTLNLKTRTAYAALGEPGGKAGVTALGSVIKVTMAAYGYTSKEQQLSASTLASVIATQSETANKAAKMYALGEVTKSVFCGELVETYISSQISLPDTGAENQD